MSKYKIRWETDYCDIFPEKSGVEIIKANSEAEAKKKFNDLNISHACIIELELTT